MTADDYLSQIQLLDSRIDDDLKDLEQDYRRLSSIGCIDYSRDRVQTSPQDSMAEKFARYEAHDRKVNEEIDRFVDMKEKMIDQIRHLPNGRHERMLYQVYVLYQSIKDASERAGISYKTGRVAYQQALREFEQMYAHDMKYYT